MLKFDPNKRITVEEALLHPYLKDLHLPDDEPSSDPVSKFDFEYEEKEDISSEEMRKYILDEILLYHDNDHYEKYILDKKDYIDKEKLEEDEMREKERLAIEKRKLMVLLVF
jgi:serine/threonine protein kinase